MSFIDDAKIQHFSPKNNSCPGSCEKAVLAAVKKRFRQLVFPTSRRRKYYVATQELLRGDVGKGVWAKAAIHLAVVELVKKVKSQKGQK